MVQLDADIICRARKGDAEAFATIFHTHKTRVYNLCLRMTKNAAEADDLTQETFLSVFRKLAVFRGDSRLSTWVHRIAVNAVLMHLRKKSLPHISLDEPYAGEKGSKPMVRECRSTDMRLVSCIDRIVLSKALGELPKGYRKVFLLHEVDGYEHQEIAGLLSCSVGTSKSQLHKARKRIRQFLSSPGTARAERMVPMSSLQASCRS
jgi:RNA polymerase sigma-70 factor (ECF subfamily)